jgi:monothiol glutaredoxin
MEESGRISMNDDLKARFERETREHEVVIYMKGNALFPRCGFSAAAVEILRRHAPVHAVDVLAEPAVRDGIKEYTSWPTIPQIFIRGQFVGGSDIVRDLEQRGELEKLIKGA